MGVPTLTVAGRKPAARSGAAVLQPIGLSEFVAADDTQFLHQGLLWSRRLAALADLRAGLRERLRQAPDRQPDVIADALESAFRHMWRRWCADLPPESFQCAAPRAAR
jgi:predicted O-linked N-acetylglucosamine transferase (SPINDLY family)